MQVLMIVSNPFTNDARVYNEARALIGAGHRVMVMARDWQKALPLEENVDGIDVVRVRALVGPGKGFVGAGRNGTGLLLWQWQTYRQALRLRRRFAFEQVHCHDFDTLFVGLLLQMKLRVGLVYDAHEIYGYMAARQIPWLEKPLLWLERRLVNRANHVISAFHSMSDTEWHMDYYSAISRKPVTVVLNCKALQSHEYRPARNSSLRILYIGVLHKGRGIPLLIESVAGLDGVECTIGGAGLPELIGDIERLCAKTENVRFVGRVPMEGVIPMTLEADVVYLVLDPADKNNRLALGNKQFEAMVCGRPIICTKGTCSGSLTEEEEVGLTVEYNKESLREAIVRLRDDVELRERLGRNALRAAITKYNWQHEEAKLIEIYKGLEGVTQRKSRS